MRNHGSSSKIPRGTRRHPQPAVPHQGVAMKKEAGELRQFLSAASPRARRRASSRSLRFRLFLLAASGLAPLALVLLLSSAYLARERHAETQRTALELS